ncbi:hypothetical protein BC830DRAFT_1229474 [Chytriomyces sp. MP71]|nr:hypothetical protein BC830DRAFT_1229474 [Chytriomyces sp. MP71]
MRQMIASLQTMNQIAEQRNYLLESKIGQLLSETSSLKGIVAAFTGNGLMFPSSQPPNQPDPNSSPFQLDPTLFPNSQSWLIDDLGLGESSSFNNVDFPLFSNKKPSSVSTGSPESFTESTKSDASTLYELLDMPESSSLNITSLYGPFDVGDSREEIKAVPSLRTFEKPDHIFDLIMAQADASCPKVVRMYSLQITGFKFKILDACTVLDKTRVIEIIETFKDKNSKRTAHLYIDVSTEREPIGPKAEAIIQPQLLPVRDAMKSIPSLSTGADDLMDELLGNFSIKCTMKEFEQPPKNDEKCDMFANYLGLHVKLRNLCKTKEERAALMLNMEIARGLNHDLVNYWLEKAIKMESE